MLEGVRILRMLTELKSEVKLITNRLHRKAHIFLLVHLNKKHILPNDCNISG